MVGFMCRGLGGGFMYHGLGDFLAQHQSRCWYEIIFYMWSTFKSVELCKADYLFVWVALKQLKVLGSNELSPPERKQFCLWTEDCNVDSCWNFQPAVMICAYQDFRFASPQGCILSPCLFNLCAEYIMRNSGLEEAQAGIKLPGEISITSDTQMTPPLWQKVKKN